MSSKTDFMGWLRPFLPMIIVLPLTVVVVLFVRGSGAEGIGPGLRYENIATDIESWGVFFSVFGMIYAFLTGLLLIEELRRYETLSEKLELELNKF